MTFLAEINEFLKPIPQQIIYGNVQKLKSQASQLGFIQLELDCANSVGIVQNGKAIQLFNSIIQKVKNRVNNNELNMEIAKIRDKFHKILVNSKNKQIIIQIDPSTKMITIVRLYYFKKQHQTLFYHQINQFRYKQASKLIKMKSSSANQKGSSFLCFSSYSYKSESKEYFVQEKRGTEQADLTLLLQITNANQEDIKKKVQWMDQVEVY